MIITLKDIIQATADNFLTTWSQILKFTLGHI